MDSVSAAELRGALGTALGRTLPAGVVFDHPSPAALAAALCDDPADGARDHTDADGLATVSALVRRAAADGRMAQAVDLLHAVAEILPRLLLPGRTRHRRRPGAAGHRRHLAAAGVPALPDGARRRPPVRPLRPALPGPPGRAGARDARLRPRRGPAPLGGRGGGGRRRGHPPGLPGRAAVRARRLLLRRPVRPRGGRDHGEGRAAGRRRGAAGHLSARGRRQGRPVAADVRRHARPRVVPRRLPEPPASPP